MADSEKVLLFHEDALSDVPAQDIQRILDKADWLWTNRREISHDGLTGNLADFYKRQFGKYRIIYTYDAECDEMVIRLVGTRDDIYLTLSRAIS